MKDLHNNIKVLTAIKPVAVGTTGTGQTGKIIDRRGYQSVEFLISYGAITATNAVFTPTMKEGDVTGTMTSVADGDLLGSESGAGIAASTPRASGSNMVVTKRIGYRGMKRYVQINVKSTVTAAVIIAAQAVLGNPEVSPVAT
jgi:hypothetical protein